MGWAAQLATLFVLAIPVASLSWTITHEELLREPREWCASKSRVGRSFFVRKFFYIPTCEYCLSHYVSLAVLAVTRFTLLYDGWRGFLVAGLSLVWVANFYMSLFARLRLEIREEKAVAASAESKARTIERAVRR